MPRLTRIDPATCPTLDADDNCWHIGEYTPGGGFRASATNDSIFNLKKTPPVPANQVQHKNKAIRQWGDALPPYLDMDVVAEAVTFVPAPPSKPPGHLEYDDRMLRVLQRFALSRPGIDVRPLLYTHTERQSQHGGARLTVEQLRQSMAIDRNCLASPLRTLIVIVDDVFTMGRTFKAMKALILELPGVEYVEGLFLARSTWSAPDASDEFQVIRP